jgi:hypothetical protein
MLHNFRPARDDMLVENGMLVEKRNVVKKHDIFVSQFSSHSGRYVGGKRNVGKKTILYFASQFSSHQDGNRNGMGIGIYNMLFFYQHAVPNGTGRESGFITCCFSTDMLFSTNMSSLTGRGLSLTGRESGS